MRSDAQAARTLAKLALALSVLIPGGFIISLPVATGGFALGFWPLCLWTGSLCIVVIAISISALRLGGAYFNRRYRNMSIAAIAFTVIFAFVITAILFSDYRSFKKHGTNGEGNHYGGP